MSKANIQRIVSLAPSNTEIIFALGEGSKLVGVTEFCNYPPEAKLIEKIGGFSAPNAEKIFSLSPDLVLATEFHLKMPVISRLKKMGVNICIIETKTLLDMSQSIVFIGSLLGRKNRAYQLAKEIKTQIERTKEQTMRLAREEKPKICYICSNSPLRIGRHRCCVEPFIEIAGGVNIGAEISQDKVIGLDIITDKNPDIIIVGTGHGEVVNLMEYVKNELILHRTNAYKNNRVYQISADLLRLGPRAINGLRKFAEFIHPEIFFESK